MATTKHIVCLANSKRNRERCVAGRVWVDGQAREWLRPVSGEKGELKSSERQYSDGTEPKLGEVIELSVTAPEGRPDHQRENWHLDSTMKWRRLGALDWSQLRGLAEGDEPLWLNGAARDTNYGRNNRIPVSQTSALETSLRLVYVSQLRLDIQLERPPRAGVQGRKSRVDGEFTLGEFDYRLVVTDPLYDNRGYRQAHEGMHDLGECLLTISLSAGYPSGHCFKLIAGIIERERYE